MPSGGFVQYLGQTREELLHSYAVVAYDLSALESELGTLRSEQAREKAMAWEQCDSSSTTTRDRYAAQQALSYTTELLVMEGQAVAKRIECDFIHFVLTHRGL